MNKSELIEAVARNTGESRALAAKIVNEMFDVIIGGVVSQGKVRIMGFGKFEARDQKPRMARNPQTGAPIYIYPQRGFPPSRLVNPSRSRFSRGLLGQ